MMPNAHLRHASIEGPAVPHSAFGEQPPVYTLCPGNSVTPADPGHLQRAKEHDGQGTGTSAQDVLQVLRGGSLGNHLCLRSTEGGVKGRLYAR